MRSEMEGQGEPSPHEARDAAAFVALLRELKRRSGLTYRQLEERAAGRGEVLPRSTLAGVLRHNALPRAEILTAFLGACGEDHRAGDWLRARERLAGGGAPEVARPGGELLGAKGGPASRRRLPPAPGRLLGAALVLAVLAGGGYLALEGMGGGDGEPAGSGVPVSAKPGPGTRGATSAPAPGTYRIRSALSSLCLSERDGDDTGNVYQAACRKAVPTYALEEAGNGEYRIRSLHPVFGYGCLGVANGSTLGGTRMEDDYCGQRGRGEQFRIRPAGGPARGYRIVPVHTDACVSVPGGARTEWTAVLQLPCASGEPGQVFHFDPVASPAAMPTITSNHGL
ncbi:RICIN domain-containing protein [Streptomyces sp. NPDC046215]